MSKSNEFFESLDEIRAAMKAQAEQYNKENDSWWNGLSEQEREDAFYAVTKRIYKGDVEDGGSYRYVLYDVFGFDPGMYRIGMESGYFDMHNMFYDAKELSAMKNVNRLEVIDDIGRGYVKYLKEGEGIKYDLQDDERTLKIFIDDLRWKENI